MIDFISLTLIEIFLGHLTHRSKPWYSFWPMSFLVSCCSNSISPFCDLYWLSMLPVKLFKFNFSNNENHMDHFSLFCKSIIIIFVWVFSFVSAHLPQQSIMVMIEIEKIFLKKLYRPNAVFVWMSGMPIDRPIQSTVRSMRKDDIQSNKTESFNNDRIELTWLD